MKYYKTKKYQIEGGGTLHTYVAHDDAVVILRDSEGGLIGVVHENVMEVLVPFQQRLKTFYTKGKHVGITQEKLDKLLTEYKLKIVDAGETE